MQTNYFPTKVKKLFFLLLMSNAVIAQTSEIDSLRMLLQTVKDTNRINILNDISCSSYSTNNDSVITYASQAYNESKQINYLKGESVSLVRSRVYAQQKGDPKAIEYYLNLQIPLSISLKDYNGVVTSYGILGGILFYQGKYKEALAAFDKAIQFVPLTNEDCRGLGFRYTDNESNYSVIYASKGSIYKTMGDYEMAYKMYKKSISSSQKVKDKFWYSQRNYYSLNRLAVFFEDIGEFTLSAEYFNEANKFVIEKDGTENIHWASKARASYNNRKFDSALYYYKIYLTEEVRRLAKYGGGGGDSTFLSKIYIGTKEYGKATEILLKALEKYKLSSWLIYEMEVLVLLPKAYIGKNDLSNALKYANDLIILSEKFGSRPQLRDGYQLLAEIYEKKGDKDKANFYYRKYSELKDELKTDEFKQKLQLYKAEEREKQKQSSIEQLKKEKRWLTSGIILLAISIASFFGFIWMQRKYNTKKRLLQANEMALKHAKDEKKIASLEMISLRSQMNPHFIFNCLNSINRFVLRNDTESASNYLTKFSKLMRMVLENSKQVLIPLEEEVKCLELYIQMEQFRCKNSFTYYVKYHDGVNTEEAMIPPLLLQPFVENAIWHGVNPKEGDSRIGIEFFQREETLYCVIKDNGIGRKKASELKSQLSEHHKSMGLEITKERLAILGEQGSDESPVEIEDLYDENSNAAGTKVTIRIFSLPAFEELKPSLNL
ncbi:MAG TPA: histidine kinase [Chitinophagaceae bacterium]